MTIMAICVIAYGMILRRYLCFVFMLVTEVLNLCRIFVVAKLNNCHMPRFFTVNQEKMSTGNHSSLIFLYIIRYRYKKNRWTLRELAIFFLTIWLWLHAAKIARPWRCRGSSAPWPRPRWRSPGPRHPGWDAAGPHLPPTPEQKLNILPLRIRHTVFYT